MIGSESFLGAARERGFRLYTGVPCSYLKPFINYVIDSDELRYVGAANEGDAVAIAAGAELGGRRGVVMFQNSGLGNAVNPLTSLAHTARIPMLLIPTLRGEVGGAPDEPQHELMGRITTELLELMEIPWEPFPEREVEIEGAIARAAAHMDTVGRPYALVMKKGTVEPRELRSRPEVRLRGELPVATSIPEPAATRREMLQSVVATLEESDVAIATTGYTGRDLYALADRENHFYMVGSMGCASSLGLGLALTRPDRRVVVLDGDGAALMRLGAMATIGYERPPNLVHVLLDNRAHESTGGQSTVSHSIDFAAIAAASGYACVERCASPEGLADCLRGAAQGPIFIHAPIVAGASRDLPRPRARPDDVAARLRACLEDA
jgi:phosphonopyruvate decarboxylase